MQNLLVRFSIWLSLFSQTQGSRIKILVMSKSSKRFRQLKTDKKQIVILGNGPSLKSTIQENENFFEGKGLFCVNHFATTEFYTKLKPAYYLITTPELFSDSVFDEFIEASNKLFNTIADKTTWKLKLLVKYDAKQNERWRKILEKNKNIEIIYLNLTPVEGFKKFMFRQFNKANGMPRPHNIMIPCLFTAIHLAPEEIFIIGAEHTWLNDLHVDENNDTYFNFQHFYDANKTATKFCYFDEQSHYKLHEVLRSFSIVFSAYHTLNDYAKYKNINIFNCTPVSHIDAFKRCKINDLLSIQTHTV